MMCPVCGLDTAVKDTRSPSPSVIKRRRVCGKGHKTTTFETTVNPTADLRRREARSKLERAWREHLGKEENARRDRRKYMRKLARAEAREAGEPVEIIYQRWGVA